MEILNRRTNVSTLRSAPRPEWSSFCEEERRAKKRERRADKGAQIDKSERIVS